MEGGGAELILALEGRAAVEQEEEEVEEDEEDEQNVPPVVAVLSIGTTAPLPGSRGTAADTGDGGIWEGSRGWLRGGDWDSWVMGDGVCGSD